MSTLLFLRDVVRSPVQMGAVAPSSRRLAGAMVDAAEVGPGHHVLELGAGSGSFTREIAERHPRNLLVALERSADLATLLAARFPSARVIAEPVERLDDVVAAHSLPRFDRVVSGLPWALWSEARQAAILDALLPHLAPRARFVTFHYIHSRALGRVASMRRLLSERFAEVHQSDPVWQNLPPAFVHVAFNPRTRVGAAES